MAADFGIVVPVAGRRVARPACWPRLTHRLCRGFWPSLSEPSSVLYGPQAWKCFFPGSSQPRHTLRTGVIYFGVFHSTGCRLDVVVGLPLSFSLLANCAAQ